MIAQNWAILLRRPIIIIIIIIFLKYWICQVYPKGHNIEREHKIIKKED